MSGLGIAETAPVIEKIKADSADYLRGLNSCGDITWSVYDKAFDFYMELISRAYEQGKKDAGPHWISCSEQLPEEGQIVLATHLGGLDPSRQVIEHIYSGGKFLLNWEMDMEMYSPTFGQRYMGKVIAWMPLPEPWKGDAE